MTPTVKTYTIGEVAKALHASVRTVYRLMASGKLRYVKVRRRTVIRETALEQYLQRAEQ